MPSLYGLSRAIWRALPSPLTRSGPALAVRRALRRLVARSATFDDVYDRDYFLQIEGDAGDSYRVMAADIVGRLAPRFVLDVGCGSGALLAGMRSLGVSGRGLESSRAGRRLCRQRGVRVEPFDVESPPANAARNLDLVVSMEVAEHLPATMADAYVAFLCRPGVPVVFTGARPGQGGSAHLNEQPASYWIERFNRHGMRLDRELSTQMRADWRAAGVASWFRDNLMVFRPGDPL